MTEPTTPGPRRRHLMDPNAPRPTRDYESENKSLSTVQRWVMSTLLVTTILHLCVGLVVAALYLDDPRPGARVGLCLIAAVFGVIALAVAFMIHGRRPVTPWVLLGVLPGLVGLWLIR